VSASDPGSVRDFRLPKSLQLPPIRFSPACSESGFDRGGASYGRLVLVMRARASFLHVVPQPFHGQINVGVRSYRQ